MTKRKAKKQSLEIWRYLAEHPEVDDKENLPDALYKKIRRYECECPLCECFKRGFPLSCRCCPLSNCMDKGSLFNTWVFACTDTERREAAQSITRLIEEWKI